MTLLIVEHGSHTSEDKKKTSRKQTTIERENERDGGGEGGGSQRERGEDGGFPFVVRHKHIIVCNLRQVLPNH